MHRGRVDDSADLFFAVFADANEIGMLPPWGVPSMRRPRIALDRRAVDPQLGQAADYLRQLRGFDHVIVSNRAVVDAVERMTGVPCTYFPLAIDAVRYTPPGRVLPPAPSTSPTGAADSPEPTTPWCEHGRRCSASTTTTRCDPWSVTDHAEHRLVPGGSLQRTRYSIVYRINDEPGRIERTGGGGSLTNRYFEALGPARS